MVSHRSLGELEEAQDQVRANARQQIDLAEEYLGYYRSRVRLVQESFYELSAHEGIADDPGFRTELQRVSDFTEENVRAAGRKISELEEDYDAMVIQQSREREDFIEAQRQQE